MQDQNKKSNNSLEDYSKTIPEKLSLLKQLITLVNQTPSYENLKNLTEAVRKLEGSSLLHGHIEVSALCKDFEKELLEVIETKTPFKPKDYLNLIVNAFEKNISKHSLSTKISSRLAKVATIGLGYTGLSLLEAFGEKGFSLLGYDYDEKKIESLKNGKSYYNFTAVSNFTSWLQTKQCEISSNSSILEDADVIIICVTTSLDDHHFPDTSAIYSAFSTVATYLKPGQLIILQSTIYPGATERGLLPLLEKSHLTVGKDFFLAYAPEICDPGNPDYALTKIPKIIGGITPSCLEMATLLYQSIGCQTFSCASTQVAEAAKLLQNTYRLINISFINEMKIAFDRMGLDVWQVIDAAATKPFGFTPFYPSPGIGGDCIPVVPAYLSWEARETNAPTSLIDCAITINSSIPYYVVEKIGEALNTIKKSFSEARILVLGVGYKQNLNDIRESASLPILSLLQKQSAHVDYHDPHVANISSPRHYPDMQLSSIHFSPEALASYDVTVIATDHSFYNWDEIARHCHIIIDTRNVMASIPAAKGKTIKA